MKTFIVTAEYGIQVGEFERIKVEATSKTHAKQVFVDAIDPQMTRSWSCFKVKQIKG